LSTPNWLFVRLLTNYFTGCRLPGQIKSPSDLWKLLEESRSAQSDFPANRLNIDSWYHPDSHRPGAISTRGGYFLGDDDEFRNFDGSFFGISPLEAATMDPQQRKLLEVVYESLESAGVSLERANGSNTACYVGNFTSDALQMQARDAEFGAAYTMTVSLNRSAH
jgi:acyl transferase domain-containing protein